MTPTPTTDAALRAMADVLRTLEARLLDDGDPFCGDDWQLMQDTRAALALAGRVRTWRRLDEEQPEEGQLCLTWPGRLGLIIVEGWRLGLCSGFRRENVTHWQPLPPPPEAAP